MCAFWATLTNHFDLKNTAIPPRARANLKLNHGSRNSSGSLAIFAAIRAVAGEEIG
jgi:hypothetical protein